MCNEAKETHESLLKYLSPAEKEKHEVWFKAKLLSVNDFNDAVNRWLENPDISQPAENVNNEYCAESEVHPSDSISNVETIVSSKTSSRSSKSSTASARIRAVADRAALEARAAALKEKRSGGTNRGTEEEKGKAGA